MKYMFRSRLVVIGVAAVIGLGSLVFTERMARRLGDKERGQVEVWAYALARMGDVDHVDPLVRNILNENNDIPFMITNDRMEVQTSHLIDERVLAHPDRLRGQIEKLASNPPLVIERWDGTYYLFYGNSQLLGMLRWFPVVQLLVIAIFAIFAYITLRSTKHDEQNRIWIGQAKETAHQLGTPTSSLLGWLEYLRGQPIDQAAVTEMESDLKRLMKVVDRFSKIGSETSLTTLNVNELVGESVLYFRSRIPKNVSLRYNGLAIAPLEGRVNEALFEWVVENLLKNALDALAGKGEIDVRISDDNDHIYIDVSDTGKGIAKANRDRIFQPGFSTKTRGWGLGLSLSRRIVEEYHHGKIAVLSSEVGKGTTMRITLNKN